MQKVTVQPEYRATHSLFFYKPKERWVLEYFLPSEEKIKMTLTLPKGTTATKAKAIAKSKEYDLMKGLLTEKEYQKLCRKHSSGMDWTIEAAIREYREVTAVRKSFMQREKESYDIPCRFKFFVKNYNLKLISEITERHLIDYKNHLIKQVHSGEIAPATAPTFLATVKKVFSWLEENKMILVNPGKNIKPI